MLYRPFVLFLCKFPGKVTALTAAALTAEFSPLCQWCLAASFADPVGSSQSTFWLRD